MHRLHLIAKVVLISLNEIILIRSKPIYDTIAIKLIIYINLYNIN